jgi:aminomethyltransferase
VRAADVIDVRVRDHNGLHREIVFAQTLLDLRDVVSRIDNNGFASRFVAKNRTVALKHADGQNNVDHNGVPTIIEAMDEKAYRALHENAAWIDLSGRGKIRVTGEDRARLLHAMCTNHIEDLQPGSGCYAFFLTAQGRIIADAHVFCMPDHLLIDCEPESRAPLLEHLDKFIIADDVTLHDFTDATSTISLDGPLSQDLLESLGAVPAHLPGTLVEWGRLQIAHKTYTGGPGYCIFVPAENKAELLEQLGAPEADLQTADTVRLEYGRPRFGVDFGGTNIPHETGLLDAVHFSKGCYIGQEIVERVRSRGHVNRILTHLVIDGENVPPRGAKVMGGDKEAGEIASAAFSLAKGMVFAFAILRAELVSGPLTVNDSRARPMPIRQ